MSYFHKRDIKKGVYGELSKIQEELDEALDAQEQEQPLMLLIELADIVGAAAGVARQYGFSLDDLSKFAKLRSEVARREENDANYDKLMRKQSLEESINYAVAKALRQERGQPEEPESVFDLFSE